MKTNTKLKIVSSTDKPRVPTLTNHADRVAARYGEVILRAIKHSTLLSSVDYFTRESLMLAFKDNPAFGRVSTITRYQIIRKGVSSLIDQGMLVSPGRSRNNLSLPAHARRAAKSLSDPVPIHMRYFSHIHALLRSNYKLHSTTSVMAFVWLWVEKGDGNLTEDNMRVIVRQAFRHMTKLYFLQENDDYTYKTLPSLYEKRDN